MKWKWWRFWAAVAIAYFGYMLLAPTPKGAW